MTLMRILIASIKERIYQISFIHNSTVFINSSSTTKNKMFQDLRVLSIQSHVVHGHVGNKSAVFPLQILGFDVDSINTVQFCVHTGYKHVTGTKLKNEEMLDLLRGLEKNGVDNYTHLLTGYSVSPEALEQMGEVVKKLREKNPQLIYVCDPVMGDEGKMYVPEAILPIYRDKIVPLADILAPNQFEAELLTGLKVNNEKDAWEVIKAIHKMGVKTVALSSTELGDEHHMVALASTRNGKCFKILIPRVEAHYVGTGDLFAALFMAWFQLSGESVKVALEKTIASMQTIIKSTFERARKLQPTGNIPPALLELRLVQNKRAIEEPQVMLHATEVDIVW